LSMYRKGTCERVQNSRSNDGRWRTFVFNEWDDWQNTRGARGSL